MIEQINLGDKNLKSLIFFRPFEAALLPSRSIFARLCCALAAGLVGLMAAEAACAAEWISTPEAAVADKNRQPIALQFRREIALAKVPTRLTVRVSADQRYVLYVNGRRIAAGPSRGDMKAWREARIDLAPYMRRGTNVIAAEVWSDGRFAPLAQITSGTTAFRLAAEESSIAALLDTGSGWQVRVDRSRTVAGGMIQLFRQICLLFYAAGGPETIDAALQQTDWADLRTSVSDWTTAAAAFATPPPYRLVADALPQMRRDRVPSGQVVRASGIAPGSFPRGPLTIPRSSEVALLIDAGRVLAAYPVLHTSGGKGAVVTMTYAEALYDPAAPKAGSNNGRGRFVDRSRVGNGDALGLIDTLKPDGGKGRSLAPFWWRTWRFLEIKVKTGDEPLVLDRLDTLETGYPFVQRGHFASSDPELDEIWRVGWRTALVDAHETYMDTAYWEQLQYIGDSRIQMLLSYDVSGDPRLAVQALDAFDSSRQIEGMPQSAWPETNKNLIPPFGLLWIGALHDFWMRQTDDDVLRRNLGGLRAVLDWYALYLRPGGILAPTPGWSFVDWKPGIDGMATRGGKGPDSCIVTLQYLGALQEAAELEGAVGDAERQRLDKEQAAKVREGLMAQCWVADRGLFADTPAKDRFSQHANALAVLHDVVPAADRQAVMDRIIVPGKGLEAPDGITPSTYYFAFYLARALDHAGMGDRYLDLLQSWRAMLAQHFTTWPESPDPSRSDSHAWSAHPTSGLLTYVAGIQPSAPHFAKVRITPNLGKLKHLDAAMAHPAGLIAARYDRRAGRLAATIALPNALSGEFVWGREVIPLHGGRNRIVVEDAR
ncbi:MAG: hypothetical protein KGQ75_00030 [Sphingomonadales bacterium]|nr:hypothetical protein [Sphingomonadales bacterium]